VLAINGTKDLQVIATENLDGIKKSLEKAGNKKFEIKPFENLNHLFQTANSGAVSEYVTIEETISPAVLNTMSNWILKQ
ncbi:MAG TPA: alpha/beta hydrolase, partial [Flavobacterium sp.]|nr:alpha/beta hydrolase [Flavobacterium sp.]